MKERHRESERHRQAELDRVLGDATAEVAELERNAAAEEEKVEQLRRILERKRELLTQIRSAQQKRMEAEKQTRAAERLLEFERRRAERLGKRRNGPRDGRPVRVEVDDAAWAELQRDAITRGGHLIDRMGELVRVEVDQLVAGVVVGAPSSRRRRGPGEAAPSPVRRFLRIEVDDHVWRAVRLAATDLGLTSARYLGEIAEAEAHRLGWRSVLD